MDIVEEMYSEKDSLETTIEFGDNFPIIPKIENSWCDKVWSDIIEAEGELGLIARESEHEANAYIFFTADQAGGGLGIAGKIGSVCDPDRGERITISQYKEGQWKGPDMYTAEVNIIFINSLSQCAYYNDTFRLWHMKLGIILACHMTLFMVIQRFAHFRGVAVGYPGVHLGSSMARCVMGTWTTRMVSVQETSPTNGHIAMYLT